MGTISKQPQPPREIYTDQEGGIIGKEFQKWLTENGILHITTRGHANTAERAIRTFRDLMTRRLEGPRNEHAKWYDALRLSVLMKYNQRMKNRTTGLTPFEASEKEKWGHRPKHVAIKCR